MNRRTAFPSEPPCPWLERSLLCAVGAEPAEFAAVQAHLRDCAACRQAHAGACKTVAALCALPRLEAPDLTQAVLARLPKRQAGLGRFLCRAVLTRAAALLLVAGALALALARIQRTDSRDATRATPRIALHAPTAPSSATDDARRDAVAWLAATQDPDGSWDVRTLGGRPEHAPALTALALMALHDTAEPRHAAVLRRGAAALLARQRDTGGFGAEGPFMLYNHGMATVALLQLLPTFGTPAWRPALDAAIAFIHDAQQPTGGWGYKPGPSGGPANASVSAWQLDALGRARQQGWDDREGHLRRGLFWLSTLADNQGIVGYQQAGDLPSSRLTNTALGVYCLTRAGEGLQGTLPAARAMARALKQLVETQAWPRDPNPYRDYFVARAVQAWSATAQPNSAPPDLAPMRQTLEASRIASGPARGAWEPRDAYARVGGRLYATSLGALALRPAP